MAKKGVAIDLKESKKSVEQALRELKFIMDEDIEMIKERKYYVKPTKIRREKNKKRKLNISRYNRMK